MKQVFSLGIVLLFITSCIVPNITGYNIDTKAVDITDVIISSSFQNGSLSGYVNDTHGFPIYGVVFRATCGGLNLSNISDSSGFYYIGNVPIVDCYWNVSTSRIGYRNVWVEMSIDENTTHNFVLNYTGKTLYVGGTGSGNYSRIQDAINVAENGDTVYVYNGVYYENLFIVNKSIKLIGESKSKTIIDAVWEG